VILWGAPRVGSSLAGDTVSTRKVTFGSQEEQIRYLRQVVDQYRCVYAIRARARDIVFRQRGCLPKDKRSQALAIASWVQDNITYVEERPETFQTPTSTVAQGYGDCDDFVQLIAAMLESIGIESQLVALQWPEDGESYYRHIFARAVFVEGGRRVELPLDATISRSVYDLTDPIRLARETGKRPLTVFVG
jgi:transglutaminase-like putative cysteine protease